MEYPVQPVEEAGLIDKMRFVKDAARAEHATVSTTDKATLMATLGGLAFEWGTGNEALIGLVAGNAHQETNNALVTGLVTGATSFAEQSAIGGMMAVTIYNFPRVVSALRTVTGGDSYQPKREPGRFSRFGKSKY